MSFGEIMARVDAVARDPTWLPYHGWHDDHRDHDHTPAYMPAFQQVRDELGQLLEVLEKYGLNASCLQLGVGTTNASHEMWRQLFAKVVSIDQRVTLIDDVELPGHDTRSVEALELAAVNGSYDLLFIDAGHSFEDVQRDHMKYSPLVRQGGIIAFHDAIRRRVLPDLEVWLYLKTLMPEPAVIGKEVGTAWMVKG